MLPLIFRAWLNIIFSVYLISNLLGYTCLQGIYFRILVKRDLIFFPWCSKVQYYNELNLARLPEYIAKEFTFFEREKDRQSEEKLIFMNSRTLAHYFLINSHYSLFYLYFVYAHPAKVPLFFHPACFLVHLARTEIIFLTLGYLITHFSFKLYLQIFSIHPTLRWDFSSQILTKNPLICSRLVFRSPNFWMAHYFILIFQTKRINS